MSTVLNLEEHWIGDVQPSQMVQGRLRKDYLVPLLEVFPANERDWKGLVLVIEAPWDASSEEATSIASAEKPAAEHHC
eukprot:CAMPEP_0170602822 /NCGR_PEP_ID=MMETSP0224-20130122/18593_1 /TAXON_ID=285029 /ORGANISM="Togula jolla, Strain CCCM 725" /LENGTH=77 /DNA_ID=CAMNT_0010927681 /DNA_START=865 /DNA_END=1098 /DNA_ORIENTATION=+